MFYLLLIAFVVVYFLLCYYVAYNGYVWLRDTFSFPYKKSYFIFVILLSFTVFLQRIFPWKLLSIISGIWIFIIGYSLFLLPIMNLLYFFLKRRGTKILGSIVVGIFIFMFVYGSYNAWNPVVRTYEITLHKQSEQKELHVIFVSDLHLGDVVGKKHLQKLVDITSEIKPDMILIGGDIIDDQIEPYLKENMGEVMKKLDAPLGVYATTGNHDYYGGDVERLIVEMEKAEVKMLKDEVVIIENSFILVGRNDRTDSSRKSMEEMMEHVDKTKPVLMIDHQPNELDKASQNGIDVLFSGHTHRGQIAPANIFTGMLYENDWGYLQKGNFHSIVSSGFGLWGPPFRIGTRSEVVEVIITFK